jgi:hypothetical protein
MKLRTLRQWPALFVTVLAFFAGPMAYGAEDRSVTSFLSGALDDGAVDRDLNGAAGEVVALCRRAALEAESGHPTAREFRALAERIDAVVARVMDQPGERSVRTQRALAGVVLAAEAMRNADNRIRKAALVSLTSARMSRWRVQDPALRPGRDVQGASA